MKSALLNAAAGLAAITCSPAALAQTDPDAAMAAQREMAPILNRARADFRTDIGTFSKAITFEFEIRSPCESMLWIRAPRLERNGRFVEAQGTGTGLDWRYVTGVYATDITDAGPGAVGVVIERGSTTNLYGMNSVEDQQRFIAASERLRAACRPKPAPPPPPAVVAPPPHVVQPGPLGAVGTWRKCHWLTKHAITAPNGDQSWGPDIRKFVFDVTLSSNGQFVAQGDVFSYSDPVFTGTFTATGSWTLVGRNVQLNGIWYLPDGRSYPRFWALLDTHEGEYLGSWATNRYYDDLYDTAGCSPS